MSKQRNIYCIDGNWNTHPRSKQSIRPILEILNHSCGIKYIYRKCNTKADFFEALRQYTFSRYKNYSILYICFHGLKNGICIGKEFVTLQEIADVLEGYLTDCFVLMGCCSVLNVKQRVIDEFLTKTGASLVGGYRKQVDFVEATAWEIIWLKYLQSNTTLKTKKTSELVDNLSFSVLYY